MMAKRVQLGRKGHFEMLKPVETSMIMQIWNFFNKVHLLDLWLITKMVAKIVRKEFPNLAPATYRPVNTRSVLEIPEI